VRADPESAQRTLPGVNFINVFHMLFCTNVVSAAFFLRLYVRMYVKKVSENNIRAKKLEKNVDEIGASGRQSFYAFGICAHISYW